MKFINITLLINDYYQYIIKLKLHKVTDKYMHKIGLKNVVWKEGNAYVAWNLNTGVSSFGDTKKEAIESLQEALELHLEDIPISKIQKIERPVLEVLSLQYA